MMNLWPGTTAIIWLLVLPILVGGYIVLIDVTRVNRGIQRLIDHAEGRRQRPARGRFQRFILAPFIAMLAAFGRWTHGIRHDAFRQGLRVTIGLYALELWCLLLYLAFVIVVVVAICIAVVAIIFQIIAANSPEFKEGYERGRRAVQRKQPLARIGSGERINPDTGEIEVEGALGWVSTGRRVNSRSGQHQTDGIFGWQDSDVRTNQSTGRQQHDGLFGYHDADTRVDPNTGRIQRNGEFGWVDTDERIDLQTGRHQRYGSLGWYDD